MCMVYFPLQNEDPLANIRKAILMNQALNVEGTSAETGPHLLSATNMKYIHSFPISHDNDRVLEFRSVVCMDSAR